jgi:hypothetical protein
MGDCPKEVTLEEKKRWMEGIGKDTYITTTARMNQTFLQTGCELTAAVLRARFRPRDTNPWWTTEIPKKDVRLFVGCGLPFQVFFGDEDPLLNVEHVVTIIEGWVIQSMYGVYSWRCRRLVGDDVFLLEREAPLTPKDMASFTGTQPTAWSRHLYRIVVVVPDVE